VLEVAYANTTDDLVRYLDHQATSLKELRRHHLSAQAIFLAVAGVAAAVAGLAAVRGGGSTLPLRALALVAAGAVLLLSMPPLARWVRRSAWRRVLGGSRGDSLRAPRRLRIEPGGLRAITPAGETVTPWDQVLGVTELPEHVLVRVGPVAAHVVPLRAFESAEHWATFVTELRARSAGSSPGPGGLNPRGGR
jgi:hypothetical protein